MSKGKKLVIGITGMPGAGKTAVARVAEEMGFSVVAMGDVVREEAKRRGLEPTAQNLGEVMLDLRREEGPGAVAKRCIPAVMSCQSDVVVVDGVRSLHEVEEFRKAFPDFKLLAVYASPRTRFERLSKRGRSDDASAWEKFVERDVRELSVALGSAIAMADYMLVNEESLEELVEKAKRFFSEVLRSGGEG